MLNYIMNAFLVAIFLNAIIGVTLNKHYCMGRLKSVTINEPAIPCAEHGKPVSMPCCEEVIQELKIKEVAQVSFEFNSYPDLFELSGITFSLFDKFTFINRESPQIKDYFPPPPDVDFQSDYQVFLI
ncbi:MAG: hypothetical protein AAF600_04980 [Bacteroidota bacterium]